MTQLEGSDRPYDLEPYTTAETAPGDHPPANSLVSALAGTFLHPVGF